MSASEILTNVVFYVFAALAVGGSLMVAASRNIVRTAFSLLAVLFAAAALYAIMKADFIAAAQVLIYVGGILVLIIFAVMLTHRITDVNLSNESTPGPAAFCACVCLLFALVVIIFTAHDKWQRGSEVIPARAGETPLQLVQYQADGRTGLAQGGTAIEPRVFLGIQAPGAGVEAVDVQVAAAGGTPAFQSPVFQGSAPVRAGGETRVDVQGLAEGNYVWRAGVRKAAGKPVWSDATPAFSVSKGITKPAARALIGPYLFAFEVVSVLLLAALVGAAFLARKEVKG